MKQEDLQKKIVRLGEKSDLSGAAAVEAACRAMIQLAQANGISPETLMVHAYHEIAAAAGCGRPATEKKSLEEWWDVLPPRKHRATKLDISGLNLTH